jgi:hypothetical protein
MSQVAAQVADALGPVNPICYRREGPCDGGGFMNLKTRVRLMVEKGMRK